MARVVRRAIGLARLAPALVALAGGGGGLVVSIGIGAAAGSLLATLLPVDPATFDPLEALAGAVGLVALAIGLVRRKRLAWWLAVSVFVAALLDQDTVRYPTATGLAIGCLAVLAADRHRYRVASDERALRPLLAGMIAVVAIIVLQAAITDIAGPLWAEPIARLGKAIDTAAGALAFSGPKVDIPPPAHVAESVLTIARLLLVAVAVLTLRAMPGPACRGREALRARSIARRWAAGSLRPFQLGDDKLVYSPPAVEAAIVYGEAGRFAVMLGDPIGPADAGVTALRDFAEACERADRRPAAYQVSEAWRPAFEELGFKLVRVGAEAIVELDGFDLSGASRANLRHTVTRARRGGVRVAWFPNGVPDPGIRSALTEIDVAWRRARPGPELGFTIHAFDPRATVATAVAFEADGRPSAFATFEATGHGRWVLDLMRRRPGTPGALESAIVEAASSLAAAGGRELSLGLAPLAQLRPGGPIEERLLGLGARAVRHAYDVRGLEFFKAKFAPRWEPRYVALRSRLDIIGIGLALVRLHVAGSGASLVRVVSRTARLVGA